jgi:predicted outer membrane repeat protein
MSNGFGATVTISSCEFEENLSTESGGAIFNQNENTVSILENSDFIGNVAGSSGGAINSGSGQSTLISACYFESNAAETVGGAISASEDTSDISVMIIDATAMIGNIALNQGGALNLNNTSCIVSNSLWLSILPMAREQAEQFLIMSAMVIRTRYT